MLSRTVLALALAASLAPRALVQTSPLWHEERIKNFLPHMTSPEVRDLLTRTDIVVIPVPSIEQHGPQTPTGTDYYAGVEEAKLRFDRHGGVGETARALYLFPSLVQLDKAQQATLTLPPDLARMLPDVVRGDRAATLIFLAEGLKPKDTGKHTSAAEMSTTGVWSERDPREATAETGRRSTDAFVDAAVRFIARWKTLRPLARP